MTLNRDFEPETYYSEKEVFVDVISTKYEDSYGNIVLNMIGNKHKKSWLLAFIVMSMDGNIIRQWV